MIVRRQVSTQPDKVRAFLDDVRRQSGDEGFLAVVEVCGFNDWLTELLPEFGCREVVLIHPDKRSKRKTDRQPERKRTSAIEPTNKTTTIGSANPRENRLKTPSSTNPKKPASACLEDSALQNLQETG